MGELQWALLIVCVVLVVLLYLFSRRKREDAGESEGAGPVAPPVADVGQSDLFTPARQAPAPGYDEYGVGPKRTRGTGLGVEPELRAPPRAPTATPAPSLAPAPAPAPGIPKAPSLSGSDTKVVALIVAPNEETDILGPQLHSALQAQGLQFGEAEVYHRMIGGRIVYSVAGLIRPGKLIPAEAADFSTRGLTVVLQLPGPVQGDVAFDDMAATTRALAAALKASVFDMRRQPMTDEIAAGLRADVADWVRARA
jgi:cell division protein ZipA